MAARLDSLEAEYDKGWKADVRGDGSILFHRTLRGVEEKHVIDGMILESQEAQALNEMHGELAENFAETNVLISKSGLEKKIIGPVSFC